MKYVEARNIMETDAFRQLGKPTKCVWLTMVVFTDNNNEYWAGHRKLAHLLHMKIPNVSRAFKELVRAGLVVKVREARTVHVEGGYQGMTARFRLNTIDQMTGYQKRGDELSEGYPNGDHNGQGEDPERGKPLLIPKAETSQASLSEGEFAQPPKVQGQPHTFLMPLDPWYKFTPPKRQPHRQSQAEGPATQDRRSAHSLVEPAQRRETVPREHMSDEDDLAARPRII